jgi:hypothetical protein
VRRDELDRAHVNFDSAYLTSSATVHLCRALQVAEMTIAEGGFDEDQEAKFWQDIRDDDLLRLQTDACTTGRYLVRCSASRGTGLADLVDHFGGEGGPLQAASAGFGCPAPQSRQSASTFASR